MIHSGTTGDYHWIVSSAPIDSLVEFIVRFHKALRLCITAFDGGPLRPSPDEFAAGWTIQNAVMVSPPICDGVAIPRDQYDEWYIVSQPLVATFQLEVFVNFGSFTLVPFAELYKTFDSTWEKPDDWLGPIQERFWSQIEQIRPETYVAMGDNDVVVSRNPQFIRAVREEAQRNHAAG
jgi:hypothetical protein